MHASLQMDIHSSAQVGFSRSVDEYSRGRPTTPPDAVARLVAECGIAAGRTVVDVGAGEGKLTALLVPTGARLVAVEPVEAMRERLAQKLPDVEVMDGTAETLPLEDASVDAVIAAQAFHWFDGERALAEFHRVLRPDGYVGLIWNIRDESFAITDAMTAIIDRYETGEPRFRDGAWRQAFDRTTLFDPLQHAEYRFQQVGDVEMVIARVTSISFISGLPDDERARVADEVRELVRTHPDTAGRDEVALPYRTDVFWARVR